MKIACVQQTAQGVAQYNDVIINLGALIKDAAAGGAELIVLPEVAYPAYFLGIDQPKFKEAIAKTDKYLEMVASLAKELSVHIVTGIAICDNDKLYNAAVFYDDNGYELNRVYKSNMWHFDDCWFEPGREFAAFDTKFGRMGMLVCADGRVPEIARILALDGAKVIIDTVNLAAAAADPKMLMNQQYAFILPVRAMENKVWFIVSDKVGLEANTVSYLGRSMVIDPNGNIAVEASTDKQEIIYCNISLDNNTTPNDIRRPILYEELNRETDQLAVTAQLTQGIDDISQGEIMITTTQFAASSDEEYIEKALHYSRAACLLGTKLLCLPPYAGKNEISQLADTLRPHLADGLVIAISGQKTGSVCAVLFDREKTYGELYKTHGDGFKSDELIAIADTPLGKIGAIFDREAYIPEVARVHMLLGCEVLLWFDSKQRSMNSKVMQTRAAENKIFVVRTNSVVTNDTASIVNPDGMVMTSTFTGVEQGVSIMIFRPLAMSKSVVPGTNIVLGRHGGAYSALCK